MVMVKVKVKGPLSIRVPCHANTVSCRKLAETTMSLLDGTGSFRIGVYRLGFSCAYNPQHIQCRTSQFSNVSYSSALSKICVTGPFWCYRPVFEPVPAAVRRCRSTDWANSTRPGRAVLVCRSSVLMHAQVMKAVPLASSR
jgi:hypothetical protein